MVTLVKAVERLTQGLRNRVLLMVGHGVLKLIDDSTKIQEVQLGLMRGELRDRVERFQQYGFTSVPLPGAEAIAVFVKGDRSHGAVVATDDRRHRPRGWAPGEAGMYTAFGQLLKMDAAGNLHITVPGDIVLNAGGSVRTTAADNVELRGRVVASHGRERLQYDANGFGGAWTFASGQWRLLNYTLGAEPAQTLPISPPEIPDG